MRMNALAIAALLTISAAQDARAGGDLALPVPVEGFPNYVAVGIGAMPDYLGSNEYFLGGAPAANWDVGFARFKLLGNWAMIDVLPDSAWFVGPAGVLRFSRDNVDDPVVSLLPEIDMTVDLGVSGGYEFVDADMPLKRFAVGGTILHDVGGVHDGLVVNGYLRGSYPTFWPGGTVVGMVGATYADSSYTGTYFSVSPAGSASSGLPAFDANGGMRDVRFGAGLFQSFSLNWHVGIGVVYSRLLADAADSPIVSVRGSRDQFIFGLGVAYAWGLEE